MCPFHQVISLTRLVAVHFVVLLSLLLVFLRGGCSIQVVRSLACSGAGSGCPFGRVLNSLGVSATDSSNDRRGGSDGGRRLGSHSETKRKGTRGGKSGFSTHSTLDMSLLHSGFSTHSASNLNLPVTNRRLLWKRGRRCCAHTSETSLGAMSPAVASADTIPDKYRYETGDSTDLSIHVVGVRIHQAPVEVRERLAVEEDEWNAESSRLCNCPNIAEAAVLSTCNRFEVYLSSSNPYAAIRECLDKLQERSGLSRSTLRRNLFVLSGEDAILHLLRVSAGLDSLVVGEGQILGQVRACHRHGTGEGGSAGKIISRLLNAAISSGKRVRHETNISKGAVSVSSAAAEFSRMRSEIDLEKNFHEAKLCIVGAGLMTRLLLTHLDSLGVKKITLLNRSKPRLEALMDEFPRMEFDLKLLDELDDAILESDVVYVSTRAPTYILMQSKLENIRANGRKKPLMVMDISVPRSVDSECNKVAGVNVYDVDDLKLLVAQNTEMRQNEIQEAQGILDEDMAKFLAWKESTNTIPTICRMQEKFEAMRSDEVRKASNKLSHLSGKELETVDKLSKGIIRKMLHGPMSVLRQSEDPDEKRLKLNLVTSMFDLKDL